MTDRPTEQLIGPLTADEWASFRSQDTYAAGYNPDNNPLPPCCGNISDLREAVFQTLRMGADADEASYPLRAAWHIVEEHDGLLELQVWQRLHQFYVEGRDPLPGGEAEARILQFRLEFVNDLIGAAGEMRDLSTPDGNVYVLGKIARFAARIYDRSERLTAAERIAAVLTRSPSEVLTVIDAYRAILNLPIDVLTPERG